MEKILKGIIIALIVSVFLVVILSLGAIGFTLFVAVTLGLFVASLVKGLRKAGW